MASARAKHMKRHHAETKVARGLRTAAPGPSGSTVFVGTTLA